MTEESSERRTVRDLVGGGLRQIVAALSAFLVFPVLTRVLDEQELGAWSLIAAASVMLGLSDMGTTIAVQRAAVSDDHALARRTFGLALLTVAVVVPCATAAFAATLFADFSQIHLHMREEALVATGIALIAGVAAAVLLPFQGFVYARGGAKDVARARIAATLTQVVCILSGFFLRHSVVVPAVAMLAANFVELAITLRAARRFDPELPLTPRVPTDRAEAIRAFRDGAAQLAINAAVVVALRIDLFIVQKATEVNAADGGATRTLALATGLRAVGFYGLAGRTVDQAYLLPKQANTALMRRLGSAKDRASALRIGTGIFSGIILSGMFATAFTSQAVLVFILGEKAEQETVTTVLMLISIASMILSTYEVAGSMVMLGSKSGWACARPIVTGSIIHLALAAMFGRAHPIIAVAGSTIVGNAVTMVLMWRKAKELLGWEMKDIAQVLAPPLCAALLSGTLALSLRGVAMTGPLQSLLVCLLVAGSGFGLNVLIMRRLGTLGSKAA